MKKKTDYVLCIEDSGCMYFYDRKTRSIADENASDILKSGAKFDKAVGQKEIERKCPGAVLTDRDKDFVVRLLDFFNKPIGMRYTILVMPNVVVIENKGFDWIVSFRKERGMFDGIGEKKKSLSRLMGW